MKKIENYTIYDSTEIPDYEYYVEDCKEMDIEPSPENSNDYWNWVSRMQEMDYDDMFTNLMYSDNDKPCIITGSLGLWNGRPDIYPVRCETISEAIKKCFGDCDYHIVEVVDGHVEVQGIHHDGRNCFEIHLLSKMGQERLENGYCGYVEKEVKPYHIKKIKGYLY